MKKKKLLEMRAAKQKRMKEILEAAAGLFMGIFVGGLIMSLAEVLDVFPILLRRGRIQSGIPWMVLSIGIGKMLGAYLYFSNL